MTTDTVRSLGDASAVADTVVVLGASNVARGVVDIAETIHGFRGKPVDLILAPGHGRSYGAHSSVLWRKLPGLTQCDLWQALADRELGVERAALMTDIGNDLLYGVSADEMLKWVEQCANRLADFGFRLIITELPMDNVRSLGLGRFLAARTLFFPGSPLKYDGLIETCEQVNEGLRRIIERFDGELTTARREWYGLDPIHIRLGVQRQAWSELLASIRTHDASQPSCFSALDQRRIRAIRHARRWWFGRIQQRTQPSVFLPDGTTISMF